MDLDGIAFMSFAIIDKLTYKDPDEDNSTQPLNSGEKQLLKMFIVYNHRLSNDEALPEYATDACVWFLGHSEFADRDGSTGTHFTVQGSLDDGISDMVHLSLLEILVHHGLIQDACLAQSGFHLVT
jgi:hypothetical protein